MDNSAQQTSRELQALRKIILGQEEHRLSSIDTKLNDAEAFTEHLSQNLPKAFSKSTERSSDLSHAMVPTIENIVRLSIKKDINKFADALFPVIGPAIKKSIKETIRQMIQSMNYVLENTLSWRGLKWRVESIRTGVPLAHIVLLNSLVFRVEQVFLIHRKSGTLLHHVQYEELDEQPADLIAAMLTAISDFTKDSFNKTEGQEIGAIHLDDYAIWIEKYQELSLALAIHGSAPPNLRTTMQAALQSIHLDHADAISNFGGDIHAFKTTEPRLSECLVSEAKTPVKQNRFKTKMLIVVGFVALLYLLATHLYHKYIHSEFIRNLELEPGYLVTKYESKGKQLHIFGLRDPLATSIDILIEGSNLKHDEVYSQLQSFHSLETPLLLKRIRRILRAPESVKLNIDGQTLLVSGSADREWQNQLAQLQRFLPNIELVKIDLKDDFSIYLAPPGVNMYWQDETLIINGEAPQSWIKMFISKMATLSAPLTYDMTGLVNTDKQQYKQNQNELESLLIFFDVGRAKPQNPEALSKAKMLAKSLGHIGEILDYRISFEFLGYSDSTGSNVENLALSRARAKYVANEFVLSGINTEAVTVVDMDQAALPESSELERQLNRKVIIKVKTNPFPASKEREDEP